VPKFPLDPRLVASPLLASTCVTALLLGAAPAQAGQNITTPQMSGTNPAGQATTSILITGTTVTGAVANAGTISPGTALVTRTVALAVTNSTIGGGISNTGTINASGGNDHFATSIVLTSSTVSGGITNGGTITTSDANVNRVNRAIGILIGNSTVSGGIANTGTISVSAGNNGRATGIFVIGSTVSGGITNMGMISAGAGAGISVQMGTVSGGITNAGVISSNFTGIGLFSGSTVSGGITNNGTIDSAHFGFLIVDGGNSISGDIVNRGTINISGAGFASGIGITVTTISGGIINSGAISVMASTTTNSGDVSALGIDVNDGVSVPNGVTNTGVITVTANGNAVAGSLISGIFARNGTTQGQIQNTSIGGGITNSGTILVSDANTRVSGIEIGETSVANGFVFPNGATVQLLGGTITGGITNSGAIIASGKTSTGIFIHDGATVSGGITNSGAITASASGRAVGIAIGGVSQGILSGGTVSGGITNSGTIISSGKTGTGIALSGGATLSGGITNLGTIAGNTAAIDISGEGTPTTITQSAGALIGSVVGSGNANADVLNFTGGRIVLSPTQRVAGFGSFTQTGGTLVLGVTPSTAPGTFASVSGGTVNLRGGTLQVLPQGNLGAFAATQTFRDIITGRNSLSGSFASVTTPAPFFTASVAPDATTADALDLTLALNRVALAASAQDLTQDGRLGATNSSKPRRRSPPRSWAWREAGSRRPASPSAAMPHSSARASAWSFPPTPRCSSITTAASPHACRSIRSRAG